MTTLREAAEQALETLENGAIARPGWVPDYDDAIAALKAALAEQDDDLTAAWMAGAAEARKRAEQAQPLTDEDVEKIRYKLPRDWCWTDLMNFARAVEAEVLKRVGVGK